MLTKRLRTGYDIYNIQSEHVVYIEPTANNQLFPSNFESYVWNEPEKTRQFHQRVTQQRRKKYPLAASRVG
jgi:hypothetical protein